MRVVTTSSPGWGWQGPEDAVDTHHWLSFSDAAHGSWRPPKQRQSRCGGKVEPGLKVGRHRLLRASIQIWCLDISGEGTKSLLRKLEADGKGQSQARAAGKAVSSSTPAPGGCRRPGSHSIPEPGTFEPQSQPPSPPKHLRHEGGTEPRTAPAVLTQRDVTAALRRAEHLPSSETFPRQP